MPYADSCLYPIPEGADERSLLVYSDILPTGLEVGVLRGHVTPGCTVAIVGAGPVGLAAAICAQLYSPGAIVFFDKDEFRLEVAKKVGATECYKASDAKEAREVSKKWFSDKDGFDVVIEAVGVPETFLMCQELVGIGGILRMWACMGRRWICILISFGQGRRVSFILTILLTVYDTVMGVLNETDQLSTL